MSPFKSSKVYSGIERRSSSERRKGLDRRNLVRYESLGSDRRDSPFRRMEDVLWRRREF